MAPIEPSENMDVEVTRGKSTSMKSKQQKRRLRTGVRAQFRFYRAAGQAGTPPQRGTGGGGVGGTCSALKAEGGSVAAIL